VPLPVVVRQLDQLLANVTLKPGARFFLLLDELNPSSISAEARDKDFVLIRNLVNATHDFNIQWRKRRGNAFTAICAVRSEVMSLVDPTGNETHRALQSFGDEITWRRKNRHDKFESAPIIKLVAEKIKAAEKKKFGRHRHNIDQIWATYFAPKIFHLEPHRYVYQSTWARPRDLIQLLQTAADRNPKAHKFHNAVLESVQTDTQRDFWKARVEELLLYYSEAEISAVQQCLTSFQKEFTIADFQKHVTGLAKLDGDVKALVKQHDTLPILRNLYKAGVLGNKDDRGHEFWEHEFDASPNVRKSFIVHRGLLSHLGLVWN
jgi:hypothetical protein